MKWSEIPVSARRRDATFEHAVPRRIRYLEKYCIPTYDIAKVPPEKRKTVRLRDRNGIGGQWVAIRNVATLEIAADDSFKPTTTEDMAMVVYNSDTGVWVQLWGYSTHLYTIAGIKFVSAGTGARWVGGANLLRQPRWDPIRREWRGEGDPIDYRTWNGNCDGAMGASLGPTCRGATYEEILFAIAHHTPLPRALPVYINNTGLARCPAGQNEHAELDADDCPGGQAWAYPSTEHERQAWVAARNWLTPFHRDAALVFARTASTDGPGCIAAASTPPRIQAGFFADRMPRAGAMPMDLLYGMPGEMRPVAYEPLLGTRYGLTIGTATGLYTDIEVPA